MAQKRKGSTYEARGGRMTTAYCSVHDGNHRVFMNYTGRQKIPWIICEACKRTLFVNENAPVVDDERRARV